MLPTKRENQHMPRTEVEGDFPVHYIYTAGIAGEKFLMGLKEQKFLATDCPPCSMTYLPAKMFCEDCFVELGDDTYKEVGPNGEVFSFTEVFVDFRGDPLAEPYTVALVQIDGSSTKFFHKLVGVDNPSIGMKVKPVWASERKGSILDLEGFTTA